MEPQTTEMPPGCLESLEGRLADLGWSVKNKQTECKDYLHDFSPGLVGYFKEISEDLIDRFPKMEDGERKATLDNFNIRIEELEKMHPATVASIYLTYRLGLIERPY